MNKIKIVADSTCDLSKELIVKYDISIIPLCIVLGEESYFDGLELSPDEIYAWADKNKMTPKTAAVGIDKSKEVLEPLVRQGYDIIFFGISEEMSTTCNVIRLIRDELGCDNIYVIDSMNLSTGIGLQVLRAAEMVKEGMCAQDIVDRIESSREKVRASFVVDTLTYLARGGRCSSATALLANTLKLKPEIVVSGGKMSVSKKYRGSLKSVLLKYVKDMEEDLKSADKTRVFITHSGCEGEVVECVRSYLEELGCFKEVIETTAGGVISSHCGPNTLGVLFYES